MTGRNRRGGREEIIEKLCKKGERKVREGVREHETDTPVPLTTKEDECYIDPRDFFFFRKIRYSRLKIHTF